MYGISMLCTAIKNPAALEALCGKLGKMEVDIERMILSAQLNSKASTILEALVPLLEMASNVTPKVEDLERKQAILNQARQDFGTQVLTSGMNRLTTGTRSM